jgi:hypothetical protein
MEDVRQEQVRERAYQIWEREGRQEGRAEEHWWQAEQELADTGESASSDIVAAAAVVAGAQTNGSAKPARSNAPRKRRGAQAKA